jgi:Protein of unknwon function (DUF3310)
MIRPDHYNTESPYEPRKVIKAWGLGFDLGNVLKYIARAGKKPLESAIDDLEKAQTYLSLYIEDLKAGKS